AHYSGDGVFGQSDSEPVYVIVSPEPSATVSSAFLCGNSLLLCLFNVATGQNAGTPFSSATYGTPVFIRGDVRGNSGVGNATGTVLFTDNGRSISGDPIPLNTGGTISYYQPAAASAVTPNGISTFA